ncbi:MAG: S8 family peptidase [Bacteroidota bacterium]
MIGSSRWEAGVRLTYQYPAQIGGIDVVAPSNESLTKSTLNILHEYSNYSGTSCAAPHVSGTAALLLASNGGMGPDDVERVLELTADDITLAPAAQGVDAHTGYGRINACRALRAVDLHDFQYIGPDSLAVNFSVASPEEVRLELIDDYENDNGDVFGPGMYDADVYRVDAVVANGLPVSANIVEAWPRVSYSNLFAAYTNDPVTDSNFLDPVEDLLLTSYTQDSAYLEGYVYEMFDTNGTAIGWIPFHVDSLQDKAKVAYTMMTGSGIGGAGDICDLINSTSVAIGDGYSLKAFPNPTTATISLLVQFDHFFENIEVDLYNANGALVKSVYSGPGQGKELLLTDDLEHLPSGMYFYVATTEAGKIAQRIIKQ